MEHPESKCPKCGAFACFRRNPDTLETHTSCKVCGYYEDFVLIVDPQGEWKHEARAGMVG